MRLIDGPPGVLRVRIDGSEAAGGGVTMQRSSVTLGPPSAPGQLKGEIDALRGTSLEALLRSARGNAVRVHADLTLSGDRVGGAVSGAPIMEAAG